MSEQKTISDQIKHAVDSDTALAQEEGTVTAPVGTPENPSHDIFTVANFITLCRLVLTFFFLILFPKPDGRHVALFCYIVAAVTDFVDGQVARRTQTVSWLGKIMDPIMDRILLFTGVLGLVMADELPFWIALVVIGRDVVLAGGAITLQQYQRRPVDVLIIGKIATALLMTGFGFMLLGVPVVNGLGIVSVPWLPGFNANPVSIGIFLIYVGLVFSIITAVVYYAIGIRIIREKNGDAS